LFLRNQLANHLKVLADNENRNSKIIILGINRAGDSLIRFAADLRQDVKSSQSRPTALREAKV
jgi:hypothetical protein